MAIAVAVALALWSVIPEAAAARGGGRAGERVALAEGQGTSGASRGASRGYLGVHVVPLTEELRLHMGAPQGTGVLISRVTSGSPAEASGLEVGDVLASVDGAPVPSAAALRRAVAPRRQGDLVDLEVYRDGRRLLLRASISERKAAGPDLSALFELGEGERLFQGEEWEAFGQRMAELGERIGLMGAALGEELGRTIAEELAPALGRLMEPEWRLRIEEELLRWEEEGLPELEQSLRELERRLEERFEEQEVR